MTLPFPNPMTRAEARDNAIYLANEADQFPDPHLRTANLSMVWAEISRTFPEDSPFVPALEEDHRPYPAVDETVVFTAPTQRSADDTQMIDGALLNVLQVLATRYVASSMTHTATVDLRERDHLGELRFIRDGESPVIQAILETSRE